MAVDWDNYDEFEDVIKEYLPSRGEGESRASQLVTAVNKLVYKWYNDGDVYDNTGRLEGWANDLSSYANWIYKYFPSYRDILDQIFECNSDQDYEDLLWKISKKTFRPDFLSLLSHKDKQGSIYECEGPFEFREYEDDDSEYDEEEMWEDDDDVESSTEITAVEEEEEAEEVVDEELSEEEQFEELLDFLKDDFDLLMGSFEKLQRGSSEDMAVGRTIAKTFYNNMQDALAAVGERF